MEGLKFQGQMQQHGTGIKFENTVAGSRRAHSGRAGGRQGLKKVREYSQECGQEAGTFQSRHEQGFELSETHLSYFFLSH